MREVKFDQHTNAESIRYIDEPVIHLQSAFFQAGLQDWVNRLFSASISVTLAGYNEDDEEQVLFRKPVVLSEFISAQQQTREIQLDRTVQMPQEYEEHHCHYWVFRIELNNLVLEENEALTIRFTEH